jgi:serine/threonine-protein kinase PknK
VSELPSRYEPLARLGKGGGGEVWAVRDRYTRRKYALKLLASEASDREMAALVREATSLSGLEGLGVPRIVRFGVLPQQGRPYMLRELVEGESLEQLISGGAELERLLESLARAAEQLTVLHRAGLLHGDVKPANIIVESGGRTTFVDLGLAAPWRDGGAPAEGLTPRYAAPELFQGAPLTVRAEVYALGVALDEALASTRTRPAPPGARELLHVAKRATAEAPDERYPSVDEFASALRRAAGIAAPALESESDVVWPIVGTDGTAAQLLDAALSIGPGGLLRIEGPPSSGRSALLRRLAWSLGVQGHPLAYVDDASTPLLVSAELAGHDRSGLLVLVDDADALDAESLTLLEKARGDGARLVLVGGARFGDVTRSFEVPPLDDRAARELVRRAIPSLTERLLSRVLELSGRRPGELRRLVRLIASDAVASTADVERKLTGADVRSTLPEDALERAVYFLDHGRFTDAKVALAAAEGGDPAREVAFAVASARLHLALGESGSALARLEQARASLPTATELEQKQHALYVARANVGVGEYAKALELLAPLVNSESALSAEASAYRGLALSLVGRTDEAIPELERSVELSVALAQPRLEALGLASLGLALQRAERNDEAGAVYQRAILAAERASDAGMLGSVLLNLAGLLKIKGDIAGAIERFEAAVDMGRRSGRRLTARQALLNLANTDLYLGRLARAAASIEALEEGRAELPAVMRAQLSGLSAELAARQGQSEEAVRLYDVCAAAYEALGRGVDAGEARLEAVLVAARAAHPDLDGIRQRLSVARAELRDTSSHKPLLLLASARVAELSHDDAEARRGLDDALRAARDTGQREWVWRALELRANLVEAAGQPFMARRDREEALGVLEEIGARLPRDLREVYWNDPRRRQLRAMMPPALGVAATEFSPWNAPVRPTLASGISQSPAIRSGASSVSQMSATPLEQKLSRILEVNSELTFELDVGRLTARVTDYAVELARAERGFVLLAEAEGALAVYTSRTREGDEAHADFSRSIARQVIESGSAVVAVDARGNDDIKSFASVHQMMLESVACVPIRSPSGKAIGALYVETRARRGAHFEREVPTLQAFADQVAIALENARLISENQRRADELAEANRSLEEAQQRLRELLGDRTEQLKRTRQKLKDARETLYGHFGYHGLVGTSSAMRRVYALIDRIKETDVPVLITGESGTGKEMVARAIHQASARNKAKMLGVNCGAIPENLLESELFGHVRGAFTGADRERKGLFRDCDGGTILLDEIGEMPTKMQAGLLRVLQERKVRPVGGAHEEAVDVRLIFATNRDLAEMVKDGRFREDLYYRIHVVEVHIPPLRERRDDIPQLVDFFLGIFAARYKREKRAVSRDALRRLSDYDWPGNVRQLENVLLNGWVMSEEPELLADDFELPDAWDLEPVEAAPDAAPERRPESLSPRGARPQPKRKGTVSEHRRDERERIIEALRACNWNRVKAAELSGIPRRTFYRRLREYGIQ